METKEMMYLLAEMLKIDISNKILTSGSEIKVCVGNGQHLNLKLNKCN